MARGNCCDICTPPPDSCVLGACCYDDGDNVDITCEDNVTESYCLTKANSVFNARGVCGEKITCDSYYEPKLSQLGGYSYIVIKSDGSVVTWKTISEEDDPFRRRSGINTEESLMLSDEDALRIQPTPFGDNGAVRIHADGNQFCAVRKKDGTFVAWGKHIDSSQATVIEEGIKNAKKIIYSTNSGCALKEDGTIFTFYFGPVYQSTLNTGFRIPANLSALLSDPNNPVVDIFVNGEQGIGGAFCALLKDNNAFMWGYVTAGSQQGYHPYDVNEDGRITTSDILSILNFVSRGDPYNSRYDLNNDGRVTSSDTLLILNYTSSYGESSDSETEGIQKPITNVSGVFGGAASFSFIKNDGSFYTTLNPGSKQSQLTNVSGVFFTRSAACALQHDGTVVAWGNSSYGGFIDPVLQQSLDERPITNVFASEGAFVATRGPSPNRLLSVENLISWGHADYGGDKSKIYTGFNDPNTDLKFTDGPYHVFETRKGFVFSSMTHWGGLNYTNFDPYGNNNFIDDKSPFKPAVDVKSNYYAISAINDEGRVFSFGRIANGGYGTSERFDGLDRKFTPIRKLRLEVLVSNENSFAGFSKDGGIVCWGNADFTEDCISVDTDAEYIEASLNRNTTTGVTQRFIDKQLKKIGSNVNLHGDLITAGYEGCTSSSTQKDFCKTEDSLRVDCNPHTGKCDYGLGDFYPFIKVDNCKQCEEIANNKSYGSTPYTSIHLFTRDAVLVPNFQPTQNGTEVTCFREDSNCETIGGGLRVITNGSSSYATTKSRCEQGNLGNRGVAVSGDETYYSKFPTPIFGADVGPGPSGSCCFGLICEEGYNEYKHHPNSEQCRDFKICYELLTEQQCYQQKFTLKAGTSLTPINFLNNEITYKTYHDFVPDVNCVDRTGEEGCQP